MEKILRNARFFGWRTRPSYILDKVKEQIFPFSHLEQAHTVIVKLTMKAFSNSIKDLFKTAPEPGKPNAVHEELTRDEEHAESRQRWLESKRYERLVEKLQWDYLNQSMVEEDKLHLMTVTAPNSSGFVYYHEGDLASDVELQYLLDHWKERICSFGYVQNLADRRIKHLSNKVEEVERYYLKPKFAYDEEAEKVLHGYGNITLELVYHDNQVRYLKLLANSYKDRNFHEAKPFADLMAALF
jgi:hypothetical protein